MTKNEESDYKFGKIADKLFSAATAHGWKEKDAMLSNGELKKILAKMGESIDSINARPYENIFRLVKIRDGYRIFRTAALDELVEGESARALQGKK